MRAYRAGKVALANAVGTGVADDKAVYAYMPRVIRYYLDQDPILPNVETHICREPEALRYTLDHLEELVVKPVGEAGGYGITIGPRASRQELEECRARLLADPANYISQPCLALSVAPTLVEGRVEPRHVDLRPFAVTGREDLGAARRADAGGAAAGARWWSTRRRAAARRTPGSLADPLLSRYAEIAVLARALRRAGGEPRAHPRRQRDLLARQPRRAELALDAAALRRRGAVQGAARDGDGRGRAPLLRDGRGEPDLDRVRGAPGAGERPRAPAADLERDVDADQRAPQPPRRARRGRAGGGQPRARCSAR